MRQSCISRISRLHLDHDAAVLYLADQQADIHAKVAAADGKFQMIALLRVGHGAAREERPADKCALLILIVDVGAVDAQADVALVVTVVLKDLAALIDGGDGDGEGAVPPALPLHRRDHLALRLKKLTEQKDEMREGIFVFGFEYDLAGAELFAQQEHGVQLAVLQLPPRRELLTDLALGIG